MTVKQLKEQIADLPDDLEVMVEQTNTESIYGMAERVSVEEVTHGDVDVPRKQWSKLKCLVISDDLIGLNL